MGFVLVPENDAPTNPPPPAPPAATAPPPPAAGGGAPIGSATNPITIDDDDQ
jgi:hypothetical protein